MINFDFDSGNIFVGQRSVSVEVYEQHGHLHLNAPDGPILRPLTVSERLQHINYAIASKKGHSSLLASILDQSTVKPGVGEKKIYEAIALYLAGAGLHAPPIYESISLVAKHTGWDPHHLLNCEASQIDQLAASLKPNMQNWNQLLIMDDGEELDTYCDYLAASLLRRLDSEGNEMLLEQDDEPPKSSNAVPPLQGASLPSSSVNGSNGDIGRQNKQKNKDGTANATTGADQGASSPSNRRLLNADPSEKVAGPTQDLSTESTAPLDKTNKRHRGNQPQETETSGGGLRIRQLSANEPFSGSGPQKASDHGNPLPVDIQNRKKKDRKNVDETPANSEPVAQKPPHNVFELSHRRRHILEKRKETITRDPASIFRPGIRRPITTDTTAANSMVNIQTNSRTQDDFIHQNNNVGPSIHNGREHGSDRNNSINAFFGHREKSMADQLASELNREADLRGLD